MKRRWWVVVAALTVSACSPTSDSKSDQGLVFRACSDTANWDAARIPSERRGRLEVRCTTLAVPIDHADPGRGTLDLAVVRVRAKDQRDRIGSLVLNPGGPGTSGLDYMPSWASWLSDDLLSRFDLVTFDPRGTGQSSAVRCRDLPGNLATAPLPNLLSDAGFAAATTLLKAQSAACIEPLGDRAPYISTDATARDIDLLRAALDEQAVTFVGWSYGARLGAHYAHLFPDRVRALVLDGPPDPQAQRAAAVESQIAGFEAVLAAYAGRSSIADAGALFDQVVVKARSAPIPSGRPGSDPPATWDVVVRAVVGFLATPELWPQLDDALTEASKGDAGSLYDMIDSLEGKTPAHPNGNSQDAGSVIQCNDVPAGPSADQLRPEAARLTSKYPRFGEYGAWWLFACAYWTVPHQALPAPASTTTAPLLVIGAKADPSTPYAGAVAFTQAIGSRATLLTSSGDGHTSFGRLACIDDYVVRYLVDLTVPPSGTSCP